MKRLAQSTSICWLVLVVNSQAACRVDDRPSVVPVGQVCQADSSRDVSESETVQRLQRCVLARPLQEIELEPVPDNVRDSNCFLQAALRPEVTDAIKRGANSYLLVPRSERVSEALKRLESLLSEAVNSAHPGFSDGSEDVFLSMLIFIERTYPFRGTGPGPVSRLEERGRREGIYYRDSLIRWVVFEYASFLTGSTTLGVEARSSLKTANQDMAPPDGYSAKGCRRRIDYKWPTMSRPMMAYADLPEEAFGHGPIVHVGVCRDDQSLWAYHHQVGWMKASTSDAVDVCERLMDFGGDDLAEPVASACKNYQQSAVL